VDDVAETLEQGAADLDLIFLQQRVAHRQSARGQERERHPATDHQGVDLGGQRLDDTELVGDLRTTEHHRIRAGGVGGQLHQDLDLGSDQATGIVRQQLCHVIHRCLLAMHDTEAVRDERTVVTGQFHQRLGELAPLGGVLGGLARIEPHVLQHHHVPVGESLRSGEGVTADDIGGELDIASELGAESFSHRRQRKCRIRCTFRATEMRGHDDLCTRVGQGLDGGHRRQDATWVGDFAIVERNVEVGSDQDGPAFHSGLEQVGEGGYRDGHQMRCLFAIGDTGYRRDAWRR